MDAYEKIIIAAGNDLSGAEIEQIDEASNTIREITANLSHGMRTLRKDYCNLAMRHTLLLYNFDMLKRQLMFGSG